MNDNELMEVLDMIMSCDDEEQLRYIIDCIETKIEDLKEDE